MRRRSDPTARQAASRAAIVLAIGLGDQVRRVHKRRRLTQSAPARRVGVHQNRISQIERGEGAGVPLDLWLTLATVLDLPFRCELGRDRLEEPVDAGHLRMQELVLRLGRAAGYTGSFELPTKPADPSRSTDVHPLDRGRRRMVEVESWNSFGDLGGAARSSSRKSAEATALAAALGGDEGPFEVGSCWVVRATSRNRRLLARYPHIVEARFPGSSRECVRALVQGSPCPKEPGLIWCDIGCMRLIAHRAARVR